MSKRKSESSQNINPYTKIAYSPHYFNLLKTRESLPVYDQKKKVKSLVSKNDIVLIVGETGSGKTTQIPQFFLKSLMTNYPQLQLAVTQPRRVAAISVATRVAEEIDDITPIGKGIVGYQVRFDDRSNSNTKLKFLTDGTLLREAMGGDPFFTKYGIIILDEAHERTSSTDILLGLLKRAVEVRNQNLDKYDPLKLIVMSATMCVDKFVKYFESTGAPLLKIEGRAFPVDIHYEEGVTSDYVSSAVYKVEEIFNSSETGDILVFLTGEDEIETCAESIRSSLYNKGLNNFIVLPLYSSLPPKDQEAVFKKYGKRKVIISTNIAETSITIDGVVYVIDSGFSKNKVYNPRTKVESLLVSPISKANAIQRAGRAGRTRPGVCYRLYTEESFEELREEPIPEILRTNVSQVLVNLKKCSVEDIVHFDFIDPPTPETMMRALQLLYDLGILDEEGDLTDFGKQCGEIPLEPELAAFCLSSIDYKISDSAVAIAACLSSTNGNLFLNRGIDQFAHPSGDHLTLLSAINLTLTKGENLNQFCREHFLNSKTMRNSILARNQLKRIVDRQILSKYNEAPQNISLTFRKCLLSVFFQNIAVLDSRTDTYIPITMPQTRALIHPSSVLSKVKPEFVLYFEIVLTSRTYLRVCSEIPGDLLREIKPNYFHPDRFRIGAIKRALVKYF